MNRRRKKRQQQDLLEVVKQKLQSLDWRGCLVPFKERVKSVWLRLPMLHRRLLLVLIPVVFVLLLLPSNSKPSLPISDVATSGQVKIPINTQSLSTREQLHQQKVVEAEAAWQDYTVKQGDTLSQVFRVQGFPMSDLNALVRIEGDDQPLSRLRQGQLVRFKRTSEGKLDIIQLDSPKGEVIFFRLSDGGFGRGK